MEKVCFGLRLTVRTVAVDMEDLGSDGLVRRVEGRGAGLDRNQLAAPEDTEGQPACEIRCLLH